MGVVDSEGGARTRTRRRATTRHVPSYPLVVVDEYQDFSPLETAIIDQLGTESDLLIAGDDDQP